MKPVVIITGCQRSGLNITKRLFSTGRSFSLKEFNTIFKSAFDSNKEKGLSLKNKDAKALLISNLISNLKKQTEIKQKYTFCDNRIILMQDIFKKAFPDARWVIVKRDTPSLINSLMKTGYTDQFQTKEEWKQWINCIGKQEQSILDSNANTIVYNPSLMINNRDDSDFNKVKAWLSINNKEK